jgi:hypothetical protein
VADIAVTYVPKDSAELRAQWLQDVALAAEETDVEAPPVEPGTDWYLQAEADSQLAFIGIQNIALAAEDSNVLTAVGAALDQIRLAQGIPEVEETGSSGKIVITVTGSTTIPNETQLKLANGLRIKTVGTVVSPSDQQAIDVTAIDVGALTNAAGGSEVTFVSAPANVAAKAIVSYEFPLEGGADIEDDERKRDRILNTLRNKPAGGNWAYWRQFVLDEFGFVQDCYVYPAPGGPSSQLIVPVRKFDIANNSYSRAPSSALLQAIRNAIQADANTGIETVVRAADDEAADFTLLVELPASTLAGGNGQGWTDPTPWPALEAGDSNTVTITAVNASNDVITVDAVTAVAPVNGQTHIHWWSPTDRKFYGPALVVTATGATTAWVLTLDRPLVGKDGVGPAAGDYISPSAQNIQAYGDSWVALMGELGPGEVTEDANRIPRAVRHPFAADEDPYSITNAALAQMTRKHVEIIDLEFGYAPTTSPTVPASVDDPPAVLTPRHFAIYEAS